jgi:hypothetical protein
MSTIMKKIILILFISSFCLSFAQVKKERTYLTIYIDLKDESVESYNINKDSCKAHFSIYFEKYEYEKDREKARKEFKNRKGDPDLRWLPDFSFVFYVFNQKPERLKSLDGIKYITIKEFRKNNYKITSPTYIIHKLKEGTYLRWKTITLN